MAIIYGHAESERELLNLYPKSVKKIEDIEPAHQELVNQLEKETEHFTMQNRIAEEKSVTQKFGNKIKSLCFRIKRYRKTREIKRFEKNRENPFHAGADGELKVLDVLSKLGDEYHIFCGLNMVLNYWSIYNGKKNLRSAQMDFVVVSRKGIFLIEVKNWSTEYLKNNPNLSPYEQTDRAGRVLWIFLKQVMDNVHVTNVLLPIHDNMEYNHNYKAVFVSNLDRINHFIENRQDVLSDQEIKKLANILKIYVTL